MDRDFRKEQTYIQGRASAFYDYLQADVLGDRTRRMLTSISQRTEVYIFSGVIRNFLLGFKENRDMDIVVSDMDAVNVCADEIHGSDISRNSFGGYKVKIDGTTIDIWALGNTWGIVKKNMRRTPYSLARTAFFNFSSIVYDLNRKAFIFENNFCFFLRTNAMDVVFPENPNITLCILNTIYYAKKYKFPVAYNLCKWIVCHYREDLPFDNVEKAHFNSKVISADTRLWFMEVLWLLTRKRIIRNGQMAYFDFVQRKVGIDYIEPNQNEDKI